MKITVKQSFRAVFALSLVLVFNCSEKYNRETEDKLLALLQNKSYFELNQEFKNQESELSPKVNFLIEAHLLNTFNKNRASLESIQLILDNHESKLTDSIMAKLRMVEADNYLKLFNYREALRVNDLILDNYKYLLDSTEISGVNTMSNIYRPLVDTKPQEVILTSDETIGLKRNHVGLLNIEVNVKGDSYDFILDTGAGLSVIKKSFAEKLGYQILETTIDVKSATDKIVKSSLAVIDTLQIGGIIVTNSIFLVVEDEILDFPQFDFFPLAAIGFPIIEEFGDMTFTKKDELIVRSQEAIEKWPNMRLESLSPNVYLYNGQDSLEYSLDTGAKKTHFTKKYFDKYQEAIMSQGKIDSVTKHSGGGARTTVVYRLPLVEITIGSSIARLENPGIDTKNNTTFENVYGNIGQDLIGQFDEMTLNFKNMTIEFK